MMSKMFHDSGGAFGAVQTSVNTTTDSKAAVVGRLGVRHSAAGLSPARCDNHAGDSRVKVQGEFTNAGSVIRPDPPDKLSEFLHTLG